MQMVHSSLTINEAADRPRAGQVPRGPRHAHRQPPRRRLADGLLRRPHHEQRHPAPLHLARPGGGLAVLGARRDGFRPTRAVIGSRCSTSGSPPCSGAALILEDSR